MGRTAVRILVVALTAAVTILASGACGFEPGCDGGERCGGKCIDVKEDSKNCGTCGNVCPFEAPYCNGGKCELRSNSTSSSTSGGSSSGATSSSGSTQCMDGTTSCNGSCVDLNSNENHCGRCGRSCPLGTTGKRVCAGGICSTR